MTTTFSQHYSPPPPPPPSSSQTKRQRKRKCHQHQCKNSASSSNHLSLRKTTATKTTFTAVVLLFLSYHNNCGIAFAGRAYPQGCSNEAPSFYDYDSYPLPPPDLERSQDDYLLLRRVGAGKFSDVFEAVDVTLEKRYAEEDSGNAEKTVASREKEIEVDPRALVVIKCLKPVSDRKIRRELLVLSHASKLPNLARLIGVVLPPSTRLDEDDHTKEESNTTAPTTVSSSSSSSHRAVQQRGGGDHGSTKTVHNNHHPRTMPSLILEHAGPNSRWLCHGRGGASTSATTATPKAPSPTTTATAASTTNAQGRGVEVKKDGSTMEDDDYFLSEREMKYYLFHLLVALDALHSRGIMHRDVKPRNVLINRRSNRFRHQLYHHGIGGGGGDPTHAYHTRFQQQQQQQHYSSVANLNQHLQHRTMYPEALGDAPLMLIDLGLADFYLPGQRYNVRVASRHYKSPELLVGYELYDYAIDMWGVGCILAGLLTRREPFFRGKDNIDQLAKIVAVLGTNDLIPYCHKCNVQLTAEMESAITKYISRHNPSGHRRPWLTLLPASCPRPSQEAIDLLDRLLVYDHDVRLTAREAMTHPFFDEVREEVKMEVKRICNQQQQPKKWDQTWNQYNR